MNTFQKLKVFILDTLFPVTCLSCGQEDIWLCDSCLTKIPLKTEHVCPLCEKNTTPDGRVCFLCHEKRPSRLVAVGHQKSSLDGLLAASSYKNTTLSSAVHLFKYRFAQDLHIPLGKILANSLLNSGLPLPDFILPVPLHQRRLRWRGFNQSALLAQYVSQNLTPGFTIPVLNNFLLRQKYTRPQMEIKKYSARQKNIQNAFGLNPPLPPGERVGLPASARPWQAGVREELKNKTILLIDDIATTGSTLFECARILKQNGAEKVFAAVLARQETRK